MFLLGKRQFSQTAAWSAVALIALLGLACSKPSGVNPSDAARVRSIDATVEQLRQAYVQQDLPAFRTRLLPSEQGTRLEQEVARDFAAYEQITVDFMIDRIVIDKAAVAVYFHWQGQWRKTADDPPLRERGHAVLHLQGAEDPALSRVDGDGPFGMAARRPPAGPAGT